MAEQQPSTTAKAMDIIRRRFGKAGMKPAEIAKIQAAVSIVPCVEGAKCWETIACQKEIVLPQLDREMIEVDSSDACTLFEGGEEAWKQFVPDTTRMMGEWTQEVYYDEKGIDIMLEASGATVPYIIVIEINDSRRTQFSFLAHLKTSEANFISNSDSSVSMITTTWQPTGAPFVTFDAELRYCSEKDESFGYKRPDALIYK